MAHCLNCGISVLDGATFCPNCGSPISPAAHPQAPQAAPHPGTPSAAAFPANQQYQAPQQQHTAHVTMEDIKNSAHPTDHTSEFSREDISQHTVAALLPYLFGVLGLFIALFAARGSRYAMFQIKQPLKILMVTFFFLLIANVVTLVLGALIYVIGVPLRLPDVARTIAIIVFALLAVVLVIYTILVIISLLVCLYNVCRGRAKEALFFSSFGFLE